MVIIHNINKDEGGSSMTYLNEIKGKHRGLTSHIVKTEKFKTVSIIFKMLAPLTKEDVTERALIPHVLLRGTSTRPKTAELRTYLDELYGTSVSCDLSKKGKCMLLHSGSISQTKNF